MEDFPNIGINGDIKLTFYPMAGSVTEQFPNLLHTLQWIEQATLTPAEVRQWLCTTFDLTDSFARNVYTVILVSSMLTEVCDGYCRLTHNGRIVLNTSSPELLLDIFLKKFIGFAEILVILRERGALDTPSLTGTWFQTVGSRYQQAMSWGANHISNQFRHRINWLRSLGFVQFANGLYSLSSEGYDFATERPMDLIVLGQDEINESENLAISSVSKPFEPFNNKVERVRSIRQSFARNSAFRKIVTYQYSYSCAVCNFSLGTPDGRFEIEAAHIIPKSMHGSNDPRNGIGLCGIHHWAFDKGVISVKSDGLVVLVATYLKKGNPNASAQQTLKFEGQRIRSVIDEQFSPAPEALEWHTRNIFLDALQ